MPRGHSPSGFHHSSSWLWMPEPSPSSARGAAVTHSSTTAKAHRNHDSAVEGSLCASSSNNRHLSHSSSSRQNPSRRISEDLFFHLSSLKHLSLLKFKFCYDKMSVKKKAALVISWQKSFSIMGPWRKGKVSFFPLIKSWSLRNVIVYTLMSFCFSAVLESWAADVWIIVL